MSESLRWIGAISSDAQGPVARLSSTRVAVAYGRGAPLHWVALDETHKARVAYCPGAVPVGTFVFPLREGVVPERLEVEFVADDSIEVGSCRLTSEHGVVDQQFTSQLARIQEELIA